MTHTKEPWKVDLRSGCCAIYPETRTEESDGCHGDDDRNICFSSKGSTLIESPNGSYWDMDDQVRVDFTRIVACVNACAGITNEALEKGIVQAGLGAMKLEHLKGKAISVDGIPELKTFMGVKIWED